MKAFVVLFLFIALLSIALGEKDVQARLSIPDFTSRYAELAAPVPANIDVNGLVTSLLRSAGGD